MPAPTAATDDVLLPVLTDLITRYTDTTPGVVLEGLPAGTWLPRLLAQLGAQPAWHLTVVSTEAAPPPGLLPAGAGNRAGWGAPHAVQQRNNAPTGARCLAVKLDEEDRLHSLQDRGYITLGPDDVAARLTAQCAAQALNEPVRQLWQALGSGVPAVPLAGLLHLAAAGQANPEADLRLLLPALNLLPDRALYERPASIGERLRRNQRLLERLVQQDADDVDKAFEIVSYAQAQRHPLTPGLQTAYGTFLDLDPAAGNDFAAQLATLDYTLVEQLLLEGKLPKPPDQPQPFSPTPPPGPDPEPQPTTPGAGPTPPLGPNPPPNGGPQEPRPPYTPPPPPRPKPAEPLREFIADTLDEAVFQISATAKPEVDWLEETRELWQELGSQLGQPRYELKSKRYHISGNADSPALLLTQHFAGPQALGGLLPQPAAEADAGPTPPDLGPTLPPGATVRGLAWLHHVREQLALAAELVPDFDAVPRLDAWWQARQQLAPHVGVLTLAPLSSLLADNDLLAAARELTRAYEDLFSHLYAHYDALRQQGAAETLSNYLLEPDLLELRPADGGPRAGLLSPLHPLALWKYLVMADELIAGHGPALRPVLGRLADLPEPLRALLLPADEQYLTPLPVAFARRWGAAWLHYLPAGPVAAVTSGPVVADTARKLAILYPALRQHLRLVVHLPDDLDSLAAELRRLLPLGNRAEAAPADFQYIHLAVTHRPGEESRLDWHLLAELFDTGLVEPERVPAGTLPELAAWLSQHPAHVLVLPGHKRLEPLRVGRQPSDLHPLSLPHTLEYKAFLNRAFLVPRSQQRDERGTPHPFGAYHDVASAVGRLSHEEISGAAQPQGHQGPGLSTVLPHAVFVVAGAPAQAPPEALPLAYPGTDSANLVLTNYGRRFSQGVGKLLRQMNYNPSEEQLDSLLRELVAIDRHGLFNTLSKAPEAVGGFYGKHLSGQLGIVVALRHYRTAKAPDSRRVVLSLDSALARDWLAYRTSGKRSDLLGIRRLADGSLCLDLLEVKAYPIGGDPTSPTHPGEQLRAVAREVLPIVSRAGGNLLTDCRRELLRAQIFREGQLEKPADQSARDWTEWIKQLNQALDGQLSVPVHLHLVEVRFAQNVPFEERNLGAIPGATLPADQLDLLNIRLGEPAIRQLLADLTPPAAPALAAVAEPPAGPVVPVVPASGPASSPAPPKPPALTIPTTSSDATTRLAGGDSFATPMPTAVTATVPIGTPLVPITEVSLAETGAAPAPLSLVPPIAEGVVEKLAGDLYRALQYYKLTPAQPPNPTLADVGPSIIRLKLLPRPGQRLAELLKATKDLEREMELERPPVISNLSGTRFVAIDVPRPHPQPVPLAAALARAPAGLAAVSFPVGLTPSGEVRWLELPRLPHMLVGGTSGSGKSVFLYSLITALAALNRPDTLQLVLVDPKETDFHFFKNLPHVRDNRVLEDASEAVAMLQELLTVEMPHRTKLLKEQNCLNIHEYRREPRPENMPFLVVVIDEFADLVQSFTDRKARKEFEEGIGRLAQRTRSVGIHLVIATQRPDTTVIFGNLKNNLDCRVALRLASNTDSRVILDEPGAEDLIGNGDMLLRTQGQVQRLQGFFLETFEIDALTQTRPN